jgi:uncharacterized membrane protein
MNNDSKISTNFRKLLKRELSLWKTDGLISEDQAAAISGRYNLDQLNKESTSIFLAAVYIVAALLIGGGVISFVAAHWDSIGREAKIILIVGIMLALEISGFYIWKISEKRKWLGHTLMMAGTLVFGANIGLFAQIFHIQSDYYTGFIAWALGAAAMAWAVLSIPIAVIGLAASFVWFWGTQWNYYVDLSFCYYPFAVAAVFLSFAYYRKSNLIFLLTLIAIGLSIMMHSGSQADQIGFGYAAIAIALLSCGLGGLALHYEMLPGFAASGMLLGILSLALGSYVLSYSDHYHNIESLLWLYPVITAYASAVIVWLFAAKKMFADRTMRILSLGIAASAALTIVGLLTRQDIAMLALANIACFILAASLIYSSFTFEDRRIFWAGILFANLVIISRFFEYDTGLLIKSAVFILCGIALIVAAVIFESYLKKRRLTNE